MTPVWMSVHPIIYDRARVHTVVTQTFMGWSKWQSFCTTSLLTAHTREIKKNNCISRPLFYSRQVVTHNIFCFWLFHVVHPNITSIGAPLLADGVCRHVFRGTCVERVCICRPFIVLCMEACLLSVPVKSLLEYSQVFSPHTMLFPSTQPQFHWFLLKMTACKYILLIFKKLSHFLKQRGSADFKQLYLYKNKWCICWGLFTTAD